MTTNPTTGDVSVTFADGSNVVIPANLAAQVIAAMRAGDAAAVAAAIRSVVSAYAANDPNLAAAIYVLAINTTTNQALRAAVYTGVISGNPAAATQVAANAPSGGGTPAGGGGGGGGPQGTSFPSGGTSGGGSGPSPN